jgi:hypothetical protein
MKQMAFCGGKKAQIVYHVSKNSVQACAGSIYKMLYIYI